MSSRKTHDNIFIVADSSVVKKITEVSAIDTFQLSHYEDLHFQHLKVGCSICLHD